MRWIRAHECGYDGDDDGGGIHVWVVGEGCRNGGVGSHDARANVYSKLVGVGGSDGVCADRTRLVDDLFGGESLGVCGTIAVVANERSTETAESSKIKLAGGAASVPVSVEAGRRVACQSGLECKLRRPSAQRAVQKPHLLCRAPSKSDTGTRLP